MPAAFRVCGASTRCSAGNTACPRARCAAGGGGGDGGGRVVPVRTEGSLRLTLSYRPPLAWEPLLRSLGSEAPRYEGRAQIEGHVGVVVVENSAADSHLIVEISESLLPVLVPLISGLRRVFDLDAEPAVIDAHLSASGLAQLVRRWPGGRVPGVSPDAFDATDRVLQRAAGVRRAQAV